MGLLAGCSSSSPSSSPSPSTSSASPSASPSGGGSGSAATKALIKADWEAFFNASTPVARRIQLLQNGSQFASIIKAQANSVLAKSASAKVTAVVLTSSTQAAVVYDILVGGQPALKNQNGNAVHQGGIWKVGDSSFCGLLTLENNGKTTGLPAACKAA